MGAELCDITAATGATAVEYAVIVALVSGVVIATVTVVGGQVLDLFESVIGLF